MPNIPNFQELHGKENGLPKKQRYLIKLWPSTKDLNHAKMMFRSLFEFEESRGDIGLVTHEPKKKQDQNNMEGYLCVDSVSLGLRTVKVFGTNVVVSFDRRTKSEIHETIVSLLSGKYVMEFEG